MNEFSTSRLATLDAELAATLSSLSDSQRNIFVTALAAEVAAAHNLGDDAIVEALDVMHQGLTVAKSIRDSIERLMERLDSVAWDIQDEVESAGRSKNDYELAFMRARGAASLWFATYADDPPACHEASYEAHAAGTPLARLHQLASAASSR